MGVVYRAWDPVAGREVAVKTVRSPHESDLSGLRRETTALWRLRHPGVVRILDQGVFRGRPWFTMELLHGTSLRRLNSQLWAEAIQRSHQAPRPDVTGGSHPAWTRIDESTVSAALASALGSAPLPQAARTVGRPPAAGGRLHEVLLLMRRLCGTLAYLHDNGYVHRDLKPTNVFLRPEGSPVLVDFGLVCRFPGRRAREALEPVGLRVGTVHYMAPEQIRAELVDARADIYSLGCLLYEAVTGQRPFEGRTADQVAEQQLGVEPQPPRQLVSELPPGLDELILRLLTKDPRERTAHAVEVAEELARLSPTPEAPPTASRSVRRAPYFFRPSVAGRRSTLGEIERAIYTAAHGRGGTLLLGGERGVGKTLLLSQAVRQAALRDYRVVTGRCLPAEPPDAEMAPLEPLRGVLRAVVDRCRKGGPALAARLLERRAPLLARFEPAFGRPAAEPASEDELAEAVARTALALAREQPLLVAIDDLQWADRMTLAVLRALRAERLAAAPLMVVGAFRSEEVQPALGALLESGEARTLSLGPLSEEALAGLVADLLAVPCPPAALVKLMERRSRGNPARLIEALHDAAADGLLLRRNGHWVMTQEPPRSFWLRRTLRLETVPTAGG
jgi:serine/threonine protein kinase